MSSLAKIFEPGFTTKAGSPGLGLSVCRQVMEQHGGNDRRQKSKGYAAALFACACRCGKDVR